MDTSLKMSAELSEVEITAAIRQYVESKTGMMADEVTLVSYPVHDVIDRPTGTYSIKGTVSLKKRPPHPLGTDH